MWTHTHESGREAHGKEEDKYKVEEATRPIGGDAGPALLSPLPGGRGMPKSSRRDERGRGEYPTVSGVEHGDVGA
jgi:hypothetical protein